MRTNELGFLQDIRRTNVMLTRCKAAMFICTNWEFVVNEAGKKSMVGQMHNCFSFSGGVQDYSHWINIDTIQDSDFWNGSVPLPRRKALI